MAAGSFKAIDRKTSRALGKHKSGVQTHTEENIAVIGIRYGNGFDKRVFCELEATAQREGKGIGFSRFLIVLESKFGVVAHSNRFHFRASGKAVGAHRIIFAAVRPFASAKSAYSGEMKGRARSPIGGIAVPKVVVSVFLDRDRFASDIGKRYGKNIITYSIRFHNQLPPR